MGCSRRGGLFNGSFLWIIVIIVVLVCFCND